MTPRRQLEQELKLEADADFELPALDGVPLEPRVFTSYYVDTVDLDLARLGITLRRRHEAGRNVWQLKLPGPVGRTELESDGGPAGPPPELAELVAGVVRGRQLEPQATLRTRRDGLRVGSGESEGELVVDRVAVLEGQHMEDEFTEVELELSSGSFDGLRRVIDLLRRAGARSGDGRPKLMRVLGVGADRGAPRGGSASARLRQAFSEQARTILARDPGTRLGTEPEDLHKMRVATRRLRAYLRVARDLLDPDWAEPIAGELRWLAGELGRVRDFDVLMRRLELEVAQFDAADAAAVAPLIELLRQDRQEARDRLLGELRSDRYLALVESLHEAAQTPRLVDSDVRLDDLARSAFKKLRRDARQIESDTADDQLHELRIRGKRARYAAELASPPQKLLTRAKRFQDVLGEHQDAVVAEERLRELAARSSASGAAVAVGRLIERERARRLSARADFPRRWRKLDRSARRAFG